MFRQALEPREAAVAALIDVPVNRCEFGACVSLVWNIGAGAFAKSTVLRELNAGHRFRAGAAFMLFVLAGGRRLPGLVIRRQRERRLFRGAHRHIECGTRRKV
jgi:lysozyme